MFPAGRIVCFILPACLYALAASAAPPAPPLRDLGPAIPAKDISKLPSTEQQYRALQQQIKKGKPAVANARAQSQRLQAQALRLKRKLIATAARVQALEAEKVRLDAQIAALSAQEKTLAANFARDRVGVSHLLAILERLQTDMPPAMALKPDDALSAAQGAMVLGASLPRVYGAAANLARQLDRLRQTREELSERRAQGVRNAASLAIARGELDQLLAMKQLEAQQAQTNYGDLQARLDAIAGKASDLEALLAKVAALRAGPASNGVVVVTSQKSNAAAGLVRGALRTPMIGRIARDSGAPGLYFLGGPGAQVIAPADSRVLFAGPYHKTGQVLILESAGGYDLVLAGLDRINVRPGDQLLAGEPLGTMPHNANPTRLYFELRQNGRALDPAPWLADNMRKAKRS